MTNARALGGALSWREFARRYPFPLDPFQEEALAALEAGGSVLVAAPTGTGKTVVAEYAMERALRLGTRAVYTTPLKALSNQKFRDFRAVYGDQVGLLTGDVVVNPDATLRIMTTEVLRNTLLTTPRDLDDVMVVVFDEVHYLGDRERGSAWEEAIIFLPRYVQLVCLSATVPNADEIAAWMRSLGHDVTLIEHVERAVPLEHHYYHDGRLHRVLDGDGNQVGHLAGVGGELRAPNGAVRRLAERPPTPVEVVRALAERDLLPTIYFVFSRRAAEEAALSCEGLDLIAPEVGEENQRWALAQLAGLGAEDLTLPQVVNTLRLLGRGVAYHHAGLLPPLKAIIEELFAAGKLRAIFATDTLALGINVPARSVVISEMVKFDGQERRLLTPNEYRQMAGRAGRRGLDALGVAVTVYSPWVSFEETFDVARGALLPLKSAFRPGYNTFANLWQGPGDEERLAAAMAASLQEFQLDAEIRDLAEARNQLRKALNDLPSGCLIGEADVLGAYESDRKELRRREAAADEVRREIREGWRRIAQRHRPMSRGEVREALNRCRGGEVAHLADYGWAVFVDHAAGAGRFLCKAGLVAVHRPQDIDYVKAGPPRIPLPEQPTAADWPRVEAALAGLDLREAMEVVSRYQQAVAAEFQPRYGSRLGRLEKLEREIAEIRPRVEGSACHGCPELQRHRQIVRQRARLGRELRQVERSLEHADRVRRERARAIVRNLRAVLESLGYLRHGHPTPKLEELRRVYDANALTLVELIDAGLLDGHGPAEVAEAISWFAFDRDTASLRPVRLGHRLERLREDVLALHDQVRLLEARHGLQLSTPLHPTFGGAALAWARGASFGEVARMVGLAEGDLMLVLFKTLDLIRQLGAMVRRCRPDSPLGDRLLAAERAVYRGVVAHTLDRVAEGTTETPEAVSVEALAHLMRLDPPAAARRPPRPAVAVRRRGATRRVRGR